MPTCADRDLMSSGVNFSNQAIGALVVRQTNVALMAQIMQQQQVANAAVVEAISGHPAPRSQPRAEQHQDAPAPAPQKGAPEPGKGSQVDVVA